MTIALGLDLSLTSTGAALVDRDRVVKLGHFPTGPKDGTDVERAYMIWEGIAHWMPRRPDEIYIEDYAHSKSTNVSRLGELGGVVKLGIWKDWGINLRSVVLLSSSTVKKSATGNGRASKEDMIAAAAPLVQEFPFRLACCEDVCDAVHVARCGLGAA